MKVIFTCLMALTVGSVSAQSLPELAVMAKAVGPTAEKVEYAVLMPGAEDPVVYHIDAYFSPVSRDPLYPGEYLIEWQFETPAGQVSDGFSAYFQGNYYRFHSGKFQELHHADSPAPFAPGGKYQGGVQWRDQFAHLLPPGIGALLQEMASDTAYTASVIPLDGAVKVKGRESRSGYTAREFEYVFSKPDGRLLSAEITTAPATQGEQVITISCKYTDSFGATPNPAMDLDEATLRSRHADAFERFRLDSFTLESLRGEPLPSFSAQTLNAGRMNYSRGERLNTATLIAVIDPEADSSAEVVSTLREALAAMPAAVDLILAFTGSDREAIAVTAEDVQPGETILIGASALARDCGATDSPSLIFCRQDGTVADIHIGRNNDLRSIVIQKAAMAR